MAASGPAVEAKKLVRTVLFALLAVAVIAALLWFGDARKVVALLAGFQRIYVLWFLLVLLAHEAVRGVLWHILIRTLVPRVPLGAEVFAFAAGEATRFLPTGTYLQNYVLQRGRGVDFGRSSSATTVIVVAEIVVGLLGVAVLGLGAWSTGLRIGIVVAGLIVLAVIWAFPHLAWPWPVPRVVVRSRRLRQVVDEIRRFRAGTMELAHPWTIGVTLLLTVVYVVLAGADLYLVLRGLGIGSVSLWQAVAVTCFGLAFYVVLGSLEAADVGVLLGLGVDKSAAVSAIVAYRALSIGGTLLMALVVMALLPAEWRVLLRSRTARQPSPERT